MIRYSAAHALVFASAVATFAWGPRLSAQTGQFFLSAPAGNKIYVVQNRQVIRQWDRASNGSEYGLAVINSVRTFGFCGGDASAEYSLTGTDTGARFTHPSAAGCIYDCTTDGTFNYGQTVSGGQVYRFALNWSNPELLFAPGGNGRGITFDNIDGTLWITASGDNRLRHYRTDGTLIETFTIGAEENTALGLDAADGTLWLANSGQNLKQYSKTGQLLATVPISGVVGSFRGGEFRFAGLDCNRDGIPDNEDISGGISEDCDGNGVPDECQIIASSTAPGGPFFCQVNCSLDCNSNGVPDACDVDCDSDNIPDDCQADTGNITDCNSNRIPDECDIAANLEDDCNTNASPDVCDVRDAVVDDCNSNGIPDECDVRDGLAPDCNSNGIPDACDIREALAPDCNSNNLIDSCETAAGTTADCNSNLVPDECDTRDGLAPDCNSNSLIDSCETVAGTTADCNSNLIPDVCDTRDGLAPDCNSNGLIDTCETVAGTTADCNSNVVPDVCDVRDGLVADCNSNLIPDFCDTVGQTSPDCNSNRIPDSCDIRGGTTQDCNTNGVPDRCDVAANGAIDCNTNFVPDLCDVATGSSGDCDSNGNPDECDTDCNQNNLPDGCDIAAGTSFDCNGNALPDECEASGGPIQWIGATGGDFNAPGNWDTGQVPGILGQAVLVRPSGGINRAIASRPETTEFCTLQVGGGPSGRQILQIDAGATIQPNAGTFVLPGGDIDLRGGTLGGATLNNDSNSVYGHGQISADIVNSGLIEGRPDENTVLRLTGDIFTNRPDGLLRAGLGSLTLVRSPDLSQAGGIEVRASAAMAFDVPLINEEAGRITLLSGSLGTPQLTNSEDALIEGFGAMDGDVVNNGFIATLAHTQILGDLLNDGTVVIQSGLLTVTGNISGTGTIIGQFGGRDGNAGLQALGDLVLTGNAGLALAGGILEIAGRFDAAIRSAGTFDLTQTTLRMNGRFSSTPQTLEVMSDDRGATGVSLPNRGLYSVHRLHVGPATTTVRLVDLHDNTEEPGLESLYVERLSLDAGVTLDLAGLHVYFLDSVPANPWSVASGVRVVDSVGGGGLCQIGGRPGDFDGDCAVGLADVPQFIQMLLRTDAPAATRARADVNQDGLIDGLDIEAFMTLQGAGQG